MVQSLKSQLEHAQAPRNVLDGGHQGAANDETE